MKNINAELLSLDLMSIKNEDTGEVTQMTKILYRIDSEDTDVHVGPAILECYKVGNYLEKLKQFCKIGKIVHLDIDTRPTKNGAKYVLTKVETVDL